MAWRGVGFLGEREEEPRKGSAADSAADSPLISISSCSHKPNCLTFQHGSHVNRAFPLGLLEDCEVFASGKAAVAKKKKKKNFRENFNLSFLMSVIFDNLVLQLDRSDSNSAFS